MGREIDTWVVSVSLSSDNSVRAEIETELWNHLQKSLEEVIKDKKYKSIMPQSR